MNQKNDESWLPENGSVEGYVVHLVDEFHECIAKYVRKNHVQTDKHWMHGEIKVNGLKKC